MLGVQLDYFLDKLLITRSITNRFDLLLFGTFG